MHFISFMFVGFILQIKLLYRIILSTHIYALDKHHFNIHAQEYKNNSWNYNIPNDLCVVFGTYYIVIADGTFCNNWETLEERPRSHWPCERRRPFICPLPAPSERESFSCYGRCPGGLLTSVLLLCFLILSCCPSPSVNASDNEFHSIIKTMCISIFKNGSGSFIYNWNTCGGLGRRRRAQRRAVRERRPFAAMRRVELPAALAACALLLLGLAEGKIAATPIVQALNPSGVRISVPDSPGVSAVIINANINLPIGDKETGKISGNVLESRDGFWTLEVPDIKLKAGDVVFYWVYIVNDRQGDGIGGNQNIYDLVDPKCKPSPTTVNGRTVCGGQLLLEDNFDTLNTSLWKHTIQFSDYPDVDFTTYSDSPENSFVKDGTLHLKATVLKEDDLMKPSKLERCTGKDLGREYCERSPSGWDILPPTRSAQLTTKGTFSFKFGRVDIRAKTAAGAWLMSKLVLDPKTKTYGSTWFESGRMEMLRSRGDPDLLEPSGWVLGAQLNDHQADVRACDRDLWLFKNCHLKHGKLYSDEMHLFALIWTPQSITMTVDGECQHIIRPPDGGFLQHDLFRGNCHGSPLEKGELLAPFDKEFYLYIGLLVAGFNNYRNDVTSKGILKPWNDRDPKAWIKFWQKRELWQSSWKSDMEVDYVKVWAL